MRLYCVGLSALVMALVLILLPLTVILAQQSTEMPGTASGVGSGSAGETASGTPVPHSAAVVRQIAFQGFLTNPDDTPVSGTVSLVLKLYDAQIGGMELWSETQDSVVVQNGIFQIALGSVLQLDPADFTGAPIYLGISVNGEGELPRTQLLASPFAIRAGVADSAVVAHVAGDGLWETDGTNVYRLGGNVGIGTGDPQSPLHIKGDAPTPLRVVTTDAVARVVLEGASSTVIRASEAATDRELNLQATPSVTTGAFIGIGGKDREVSYAGRGGVLVGTAQQADGDVVFQLHGTERMRITDAGDVGIGTSDPLGPLHIATSAPIPIRAYTTDANCRIVLDGALGSVVQGSTGTSDKSFTLRATSSVSTGSSVHLHGAGHSSDSSGPGGVLIGTADNSSTGNIVLRTRGADQMKVLHDGTTEVKVLRIVGGTDVAEPFETSADARDLPAGAVLVIDEARAGHLKPSRRPYDRRVAGVVSGAGGISPGVVLTQGAGARGEVNVALTGRVYVLATAESGVIEPGDLLTTSSTPGHAMKATDPARWPGAVIGKAMTGLEVGTGLVLVLVSLQ